MKKIFLAIFTMIYLLFACGVALEIHYCMGKRAGVELYGSENKQCGKCGMMEDKTGCCHDEHQFYKIADSHNTAYIDVNFTAPFIIIENTPPLFAYQMPANDVTVVTDNHFPPEYSGPSATVLYCVFKI